LLPQAVGTRGYFPPWAVLHALAAARCKQGAARRHDGRSPGLQAGETGFMRGGLSGPGSAAGHPFGAKPTPQPARQGVAQSYNASKGSELSASPPYSQKKKTGAKRQPWCRRPSAPGGYFPPWSVLHALAAAQCNQLAARRHDGRSPGLQAGETGIMRGGLSGPGSNVLPDDPWKQAHATTCPSGRSAVL
jgi:hypothetical protein